MFRRFTVFAAAFALSALVAAPAFAQSTVATDTVPFTPSVTPGANQAVVRSYAVPGGTFDCMYFDPAGLPSGANGVVQGPGGCAFVPGGGGSINRYLSLTDGKTDTGVSMTATPSSANFGVSRTAGTSLVLTMNANSSNAVTNKVLWQLNLPATYVAGANINVVCNVNYSATGTVTAATTTVGVAAYTETNGTEAAIAGITAAQQFTATATNYTFVVPGTGLVVGQPLTFEITELVTTSAGAATGVLNACYYTA